MKNCLIATILSLVVISVMGSSASQAYSISQTQIDRLSAALKIQQMMGASKWKIGDHAEYQITMPFIGAIGSQVNDVTREENGSVWLKQVTILTGRGPDTKEFLVNRSSGLVVKYLSNGQEEEYDQDDPQVTSQNPESVTVPAGTFASTHSLAHTKRSPKMEIWSNQDLVPIDGMIKTHIDSGFSVELTQFAPGH